MSPKPFSIQTPLPPKDLFFESMTHSAALSELEDMQLQLLSDKPDLSPDDVLGQKVKVTIELRDGDKRHLNGYVTRFGIGVHQGRYFGYHAVVRPWLWFLTRTSDCRIFQDMTVPEIVEKVFADHAAVADFEFKLSRSYRPRVYCVQYRESDFNFVARLLEDEGIYWYFKHGDGTHQLVMVDDPGMHEPIQGNPTLPYYEDTGLVPSDTEYLSGWRFAREVQPGKSVLTSYDFERPSLKLQVEHSEVRSHAQAEHEVFDFQGDYVQKPHGQQLVETRLTEHQARWESASAGGNAHAVACGYQFKLSRHPRSDQNRQYLLTRAEISARNNGAESTDEPGELRCTLKAIPATQPYSPVRRTPKPFVQGPQTAVVVGPAGEEIYTDKYGRVKVQFHWDRYGKKNEKSSCWMRVSSPWAGKSFGFVQIPRIGQEVVVDFLEGDPDQPLITGRVYNAEQMPPWELPANATKSGLRTRSSKGGAYTNANEISFEDKAGSELLGIHAELDMNRHVERDDATSIGRDQSIGVKRDQTMSVERNRSVKVQENENLSVGLAQTLSVGTDQSLKVVGNRQIQVDGFQQTQVTGDLSSSTSGKRFDSTSGLEYRNVGGNWICESGGTAALSAAGNIVFKAPTISLVAGHLDMNITGANSVVHTSPNGPYSIMANKFVVLSNTDASILAAGKINQTSVENNVTVMGSNNSGYMGMASDVNLGLARSTFLGLSMDTFMGVNISNTLAVQLENTLAAKIECAVGPHVELNTMKVYSPGGGAAGGPAALSAGWEAVAGVAAMYSILGGLLSAIKGFDEISNQYKEAKEELRDQADEADKAGHPGLAARLRRLASGEDLGSSAPENTSQDSAGHTVAPAAPAGNGSSGSGGS